MSKFLSSLMAQYLRNPKQAVAHLKKVSGMAATGRLGEVSNRFQMRSKQHSTALEIEARLGDFEANEAANAEGLVDWMRQLDPNADWLPATGDALTDLRAMIWTTYQRMGLFDAEFYQQTYLSEDEGAQTRSPFEHFMHYGRTHGMSPNAYFDAIGYMFEYPDVLENGLDPCLHYTFYGWLEGRKAGTNFDALHYVEANPDVAEAGLSPLHHFMHAGRAEGRSPLPEAAPEIEAEAAAEPRFVSAPPELPVKTGTIVLVSHNSDVGGAQKVVQSLATWILKRTSYDVKLVTMEGGGLMHRFIDIAATFNMADHAPEDRAAALDAFCGPDVRAVFLNSIASCGLLADWARDTPVLSYIHELEKLLEAHPEEVALMRERASMVIAGSEAVKTTLHSKFDINAERLEVVHGFIDAGLQIEDMAAKQAAKRTAGLPEDALIVAACGVVHWRKSPELFITVAQQVLAQTEQNVHFVWVGGGPDHEACEALIEEQGLAERVRFTGYTPDVQPFLNAADIFLLPSEEDPFPLVCLMAAQALSPVICFEDAGGMPELVRQGCGAVVPFLDAGAMARATLTLLDDAALRLEQGRAGQRLVEAKYTLETTGPLLFSHIRSAASLPPAVSVVVPNYNYEDYLVQRLDTIAAQTFQDFEILLLDDMSTDRSLEVMRDWAKGRPAVKLVPNTRNSGSPFAQWIKGMELAESDLIWVAEADDYCEPTLLATLLPAFADRNVCLGYVKSVPVDSLGDVQGDYEAIYLNRINEGRWSAPYVATDHEEASAGLGIANCIPNGSSVIFRKFEAEDSFRAQVTSMRMCGDWLYYLRAMRGGLVAYANAPLNYHRRHDNTVTSQTEGSPMYFGELQVVRDYVQDTYVLSDEARQKIASFTAQDLDRFGIEDSARRASTLADVTRFTDGKDTVSVLFVVSDLSPGGGQMFMIRLANAWAARGGRAVLLNVGHFPTHPKVLSLIDPRLTVIREGDPQAKDLAGLCTRYDIDLIHSSIWWADKYVRNHIEAVPHMPWVTSMHGCHETILAQPEIDPNFTADIGFMQNRVSEWVHTADKNLAVFEALGVPDRNRRLANGVPIRVRQQLDRKALGLRKTATVLCLATRAIETKGWFVAVEAVQRLNAAGLKVDLMLIGEGPARDEIAAAAPAHVHLYGQVDNLHDYIAACDIGILPSFFEGESMPLVLLEMMGLGKPLVATDIGEIPDMMGSGDAAAGLIVPLEGGALDAGAFGAALEVLVKDKRARKAFGAAALSRFENSYTEAEMVRAYEGIYEEATGRAALTDLGTEEI